MDDDPPPAVSAIIPLFNGEAHLEKAIGGVLGQSMTDLELIVVDDGSSDGSVALAHRLVAGDPRAQVLAFPNGGVAAARNRGLSRARGRYVAFVDQDDLWYPQKLERQISILDDRPDVAVIGCLMDYLGPHEQQFGRTSQTPDSIDRDQVRRAFLVPFPMSSAVFRAEVLRRDRPTRDLFGPGLATAADLEFMAAAASYGELVCIREPLGGYRIHRGSVTARSYRTQSTALAYLQAVVAERGFEQRTAWEDFERTHRPGRKDRRMTSVSFHYRQAGLEALELRWHAASWHFARAGILSPAYALRRLSRQLRGR